VLAAWHVLPVLCPISRFEGRSIVAPAMVPKRIGFVGFEGATASHLVGPADTFATVALDGGYGNCISCYQICTVGLTREPFRAESGMIFRPEETLQTAPDLDTVVIPGGKGLHQPESAKRFWIGS